jgi:hypothetical protein
LRYLAGRPRDAGLVKGGYSILIILFLLQSCWLARSLSLLREKLESCFDLFTWFM